MYIRLVVTYCNSEDKLIPKEAHIDTFNKEPIPNILNDCMEVLNNKLPDIKKIFPVHLKNKDFDIILHGEYLLGIDFKDEAWSLRTLTPIFNIKQLGVPEESRPIIKTS